MPKWLPNGKGLAFCCSVFLCCKVFTICSSVLFVGRYFTHFYIVGSLVNMVVFMVVTYCYVTNSAFPYVLQLFVTILNFGTKESAASVGKEGLCLLVSLS